MVVTLRVRSLVWFVLGAVTALSSTVVVTSAWSVEAAQPAADTTVVPITACRLVDTRPATVVGPRRTPLRPEETHVVDARDASTNCSGRIPASADGLVLNVTAVGMTAPTFLSVWGAGPFPGTSSLNPVPGPPVPNSVTTPLDTDHTFRIYNLAGTIHVVVDVVGYLSASTLRDLDERVGSLESAGVDQSVVNQLAALRADLETLEATTASQHLQLIDLSEANTDHAGRLDIVETSDAEQARAIDRLDRSRSVAWSDAKRTTPIDSTPTELLTVSTTAPADGLVTVSAGARLTADAGHDDDDDDDDHDDDRDDDDGWRPTRSDATCTLVTVTDGGEISVLDLAHDSVHVDLVSTVWSFEVDAGQPTDVGVTCRSGDPDRDAVVVTSFLTAVFTPAA